MNLLNLVLATKRNEKQQKNTKSNVDHVAAERVLLNCLLLFLRSTLPEYIQLCPWIHI